MKKLTILLTMIMFSLVLSSCEQTTNDVPLILYNEVDPFILEFKQNIFNAAEDVLNIVSYDSENSQVNQNEIIDKVLEKNPPLLIINPVDRLSAFTMIDKVKQQNIPIIFINREPLKKDMEKWDKTFYLGAPAENSAILQSEMVIDLFGTYTELSYLDKNADNIIQMVILKGEQGHQDAETRTEVIVDELEKYGYMLEILSIEICDWQQSIAYNKMNELFKNLNKEVELVISNNDAMALGAIQSLIENEKLVDTNEDGIYDRETEPWLPVIGIDGIEESFQYIDNGLLYGTVINDSETMSEVLIELANAIIKGENLNDLSFDIVDEKYIWVDYYKYEGN